MKKGGLVLWVSVPQPDAEKGAVAVLEKMGARDVHVHEINREWSLSDIPFAAMQPDLFLENDRALIKRAPISPRVKKRGNRRPSPTSHGTGN